MTERRIKHLERQLSELSELFIKNDEELRKQIRDIRITNMSGVVAAEFTLAARLGITMDVVLSMIPEGLRAGVERIIAERVAELPDTTDVAMKYAKLAYKKEGDNY